MRIVFCALAALLLCLQLPSYAETPEEWITLGTRVHGFFGGFIPAGIRIGLDAMDRLQAQPRELSVVYYQGEKAPCPCMLDGIMLAVGASPGQGTAKVADAKAPAGALAVIVVTHRKTGATVRYTVADAWLPKMLAWNKEEPLQRYAAAMAAPGLFTVEPAPKP